MWLPSLHHCLDSTPVFPFPWQCVESFQSHERLWTGKHSHKDIKKSLHLHKYRHKYMWQTQAPQISFHKSFHTHTPFARHWTVTQDYTWLSSGCSTCEARYSAVENSIIYMAAHRQLALSFPTRIFASKLSLKFLKMIHLHILRLFISQHTGSAGVEANYYYLYLPFCWRGPSLSPSTGLMIHRKP